MTYVVFITSFAILAVEVLMTRVFSILHGHNTAFAVLSLALLGIGFSGLLVYLLPRLFKPERLTGFVSWTMPVFGLALPLSYLLLVNSGMGSYLGLSLLALIPFCCGGLIISFVFASAHLHISRLYFLDMAGAALGSAVLLPVMYFVNGPLVVPALGLVVTIAGLVYSFTHRHRVATGFSFLAALFMVAFPSSYLFGDDLTPQWAKGRKEPKVFVDRWGPEGRVTVHGSPRANSVWVRIDSAVPTPALRFDGDFAKVEFLRHNILQLAYHLRSFKQAVIIGPGGGADVLSALLSNVERITAVEVNRAIVDIMRRPPMVSYTGGIYRNPGVRVEVADGRAYVATLDRQVDLIQATFVDTYTTTTPGSHTLAESYLYTVEAMHDYLDHLKDDGIISMSRWGGERLSEYIENLRVIGTAMRALRERGVERPGDHIISVLGPRDENLVPGAGYQYRGLGMDIMVTTLIKKTPFSAQELERLNTLSEAEHFRVLWIPGLAERDPDIRALFDSGGKESFFQEFYDQRSLDIEPVTDDRPFFFTAVRPQHYFQKRSDPVWQKAERHQSYIGIGSLWRVLGETALLVLLMLALPLGFRLKALRGVGHTAAILGYFVSLGLGFIGIEIGLIQKFSLFLGHPSYSLVIVLSSILLFSSLGSLSTGRVKSNPARSARNGAIILFLVLSAYAFILPLAIQGLLGCAFWLKILLCVALILPPAFLMGRMFPLGIKTISVKSGHLVPWVWGVNSGFSVLGAIMSMLISVGWGFSVSWWFFAAIYLAGGIWLTRIK